MIENYTILALTHFVSDWFFQPAKWALTKRENTKSRFFHCIQYTILFAPIFYFLKLNYFWLIWIFLSHFFIDDYRFVTFFNKKIKREKKTPDWMLTVQDQILHLLVLIPVVI
jgi:hypothetical protein